MPFPLTRLQVVDNGADRRLSGQNDEGQRIAGMAQLSRKAMKPHDKVVAGGAAVVQQRQRLISIRKAGSSRAH